MNNEKKEYVAPEVNVIIVDKDVITTSTGDDKELPWIDIG